MLRFLRELPVSHVKLRHRSCNGHDTTGKLQNWAFVPPLESALVYEHLKEQATVLCDTLVAILACGMLLLPGALHW